MTPNRNAGYVSSKMAWHKYAFTTLHPGLFAGGGRREHYVEFDYFRFTDHEVFAETLSS